MGPARDPPGSRAWRPAAAKQPPGRRRRASTSSGRTPTLVPLPARPGTRRPGLVLHRHHRVAHAQAEQAAAERAAAERAARIQDLTSSLAEAVTSQDIVTAVAERVLPPFGASGLIIQVVEDGRMRAVGAVGYSQAFLDLINGPVRDLTPAADALARRRPSFISSAEEYMRALPGLRRHLLTACGKQAWAFLPLVVSGRVVGLCVVSFDRPRLSDGRRARAADRAQRPDRPGSGARPALRRRARPGAGAATRPAAAAAA